MVKVSKSGDIFRGDVWHNIKIPGIESPGIKIYILYVKTGDLLIKY
jgi:hypothetical protein